MDSENRESAMIAYANDTLRQHHVCGEVILSPKVKALSVITQHVILVLISDYDDWNPRLDPQGWHDFGSVQVKGEYYYFLIEQLMDAQQNVLARIMRVMHASEHPKK